MRLTAIERATMARVEREVPDLAVTLADPMDDGRNVTHILGEVRLWATEADFATTGPDRTVTLTVRVGSPLVRSEGKNLGGLERSEDLASILEGFSYDEGGHQWKVRSIRYWRKVGPTHWFETVFQSIVPPSVAPS